MELKKIYLFIIIILFSNKLNSEIINPNEKLLPYDVVKIQLEALKANDKNDEGIKQTWLLLILIIKKLQDHMSDLEL